MPRYRFCVGALPPPIGVEPQDFADDETASAFADELWSEINPDRAPYPPRVYPVREDGTRVELPQGASFVTESLASGALIEDPGGTETGR